MIVKSIRLGNCQMYSKSWRWIAQWMFALDHHNNALWLLVHLNTMTQVHVTHPAVFKELVCISVISKLLKKSKVVAGTTGLAENESAFQRWIISRPDLSCILDKFDCSGLDVTHLRI